MNAAAERAVERYLKDLAAALDDLPSEARREVVDDVRNHILEASTEPGIHDDAAVRNLLERLGEPEDIAAEAGRRFDVRPPRRPGVMEVATLVLLPIGGLVIPFLGWVIGVVMLWASTVWSTRDKLIGTLLVPGGLLPAVAFGSLAAYGTSCSSTATGVMKCAGGPSDAQTLLLRGAGIALFVIPIATTAYLGARMRGDRLGRARTESFEGAL